jgi:quinol monooxygenase YgiN
MSCVALVAEFEVKAQDLERFLAAARREIKAVRETEPECLRFDVVLFEDDTGRGAFFEIFRNKHAADAHRETPHFAAFFDEISDIELSWSTRRGVALDIN